MDHEFVVILSQTEYFPAAQNSGPSWKLINIYLYYCLSASNHARNQIAAASGVVGVAKVRR